MVSGKGFPYEKSNMQLYTLSQGSLEKIVLLYYELQYQGEIDILWTIFPPKHSNEPKWINSFFWTWQNPPKKSQKNQTKLCKIVNRGFGQEACITCESLRIICASNYDNIITPTTREIRRMTKNKCRKKRTETECPKRNRKRDTNATGQTCNSDSHSVCPKSDV